MKLKQILQEIKQIIWRTAIGKKGQRQMCHRNSRIYYFKNKSKGVRYCEGQVAVNLEYGHDFHWINHAWCILPDNTVFDPTYGNNDYTYRGNAVKHEYMEKLPANFIKMIRRHNSNPKNSNDYWDESTAYLTANIRVSDEFGKKAFDN